MKNTTRLTVFKRGQIVVFIVLIFQVFFIFGAMVINIGMVVHDKINLQNSVDLAAIYGAQRQAEVLDALAHINYQIRQSYKLLAWRYLILGNFGANHGVGSVGGVTRYQIDSPDETKRNCNFLLHSCNRGPCDAGQENNGNSCVYAVCVGHPFWDWGRGTDHLCQWAHLGSTPIQRPQNINIGSAVNYVGGAGVLTGVIDQANQQFDQLCKQMQKVNWFLASTFLSSFRVDQWRRKILAKELFNQTIGKRKDIEGQLIATGIENTIKNNLTFINYINYQGANIKFSSEGKIFRDYFKWQSINPVLFYLLTKKPPDMSNDRSYCKTYLLPIFHPPEDIEAENQTNSSFLYRSSRFSEFTSTSNTPYDVTHLSSGFYKKNNKTIYTEVEVSIPYKGQIFLPFIRPITLRAKAWAKPFGAVFGPPEDADPLLPTGNLPPVPQTNAVTATSYNNFLPFAPNYSSYPGDPHGLLNHAVQSFWTGVLVSNNVTGKSLINYINAGKPQDPMVLNLEFNSASNEYDVSQNFLTTEIRKFEEVAIAPDAFDLMYYTILPNYMTTLYRRMLKPKPDGTAGALASALVSALASTYLNPDTQRPISVIPGDLGFFDTESFDALPDFEGLIQQSPPQQVCGIQEGFRLDFINKQIKCVLNPQLSTPPPIPSYLHKVKDLNHLLTSWHPITKGWYNNNNNDLYDVDSSEHQFGKCELRDKDVGINPLFDGEKIEKQNLIPHHCIRGGRSGFSVKLIHERMAQ